MKITKKFQNCECGKIEGKTTLLNNFVRVGITTNFSDSGTYIHNKELVLPNNYCPKCGMKYEIVEKEFTFDD